MIYPFTESWLSWLTRLYIKEIRGFANFPKGGFILTANHQSYLDDFFIPYIVICKLKKKCHMFVNSRFYRIRIIKRFLDYHECIPVDVRKDVNDEIIRKETNKKAFDLALNYLKNNGVIGIFPEGGRSKDGKLKKGKTGAARLVLQSRAKVVPIGIIGSYNILPKGTIFPRFRRARIEIGKPMDLSRYFNEPDAIQKITDEIMKEIASLIGEKYEK